MTSSVGTGTMQITLQFALGRSIDGAATDVQTAINAAGGQLPKALPSPPTFRKANPADVPVLLIAPLMCRLAIIGARWVSRQWISRPEGGNRLSRHRQSGFGAQRRLRLASENQKRGASLTRKSRSARDVPSFSACGTFFVHVCGDLRHPDFAESPFKHR